MTNQVEFSMAVNGMTDILIVLVCIFIAWWALKELKFEKFVKDPGSPQSRVLHILLSIILGYQVGRFLISYLDWSNVLKGFF